MHNLIEILSGCRVSAPGSTVCCHASRLDCRGKAFSECFALSAITRILVCSRVSALCVLPKPPLRRGTKLCTRIKRTEQCSVPTIAILLCLIFFILTPINASAYWPVRIEDDFFVAGDTVLYEMQPTSIPYQNECILTVYNTGSAEADAVIVFNIIDKYGELKYSEPQEVCPELEYGSYGGGGLQTISDGQGGAIMATSTDSYVENPGIYAQRLDSLGDRMWGDSGVQVFPFAESEFDICTDGNGGVFVSTTKDEPAGTFGYDTYLQRVDSEGNVLFGDGIPVSAFPEEHERYSVIIPDGEGGCFVIWNDNRDPYLYTWALFAKHFNSAGDFLWPTELFICEDFWDHGMVPDGEGGFIVYANAGGGSPYTHWRVDGDGNILWERDHLSWMGSNDNETRMTQGEPGYFYLFFGYGFTQFQRGYYAQKIDLDGNPLWPSWPEAAGLPVTLLTNPQLSTSAYYILDFFNNRLAVAYYYDTSGFDHTFLTVNAIDTAGNVLFGNDGVLIQEYDHQFTHLDLIQYPDGGITLTYPRGYTSGGIDFDILAKRVRADGTLGGPNAPIDNVTLAVSGNDLILSWPRKARSASYYVYKSGFPYTMPEEPETTISDTTFIDIDGLLQDSCFYNVRWEVR